MDGKYVSLWVYIRGEAIRDFPYLLWRMVENDGDWEQLLWDDPLPPTRVKRFGDLTHWVHFMDEAQDPKVFLMIVDNESGNLIGFIWFNRIVENTSAFGSIYLMREYRGRFHAREAGLLALQWAHDHANVPTIFTMTPWPEVKNFDKRLGFKEVAFVPKVFGRDVWILEHKKEG